MQRRFLAKDVVSWLVQAFLERPTLFEYAARRVAARADGPCDDGPRDGRPRPGEPGARSALSRRAAGALTCRPRSTSTSTHRLQLVFELARHVDRWERLLPHYARSRILERRPDGSLVVDFVARRPLIAVLGLGLPVTWRSRTWNEPAAVRLRFVHVAGATRGMDVTWRIEPTAAGCRVSIDHDFRPRVPGFAAFVDRVVHAVRSPAGRWPRSRRSPRPWTSPSPRRGDEHTDMTSRRRVWITGIGLITPIGTGVDGVPCRPPSGTLPGQDDRPVRSLARSAASRRPGRRLRSAGVDAAKDRAPARPVQPVRSGRGSSRARRCAA